MPTDPAPEKVAALAEAMFTARIGTPADVPWLAGLLYTALRAAGYDVARIEEGERAGELARVREALEKYLVLWKRLDQPDKPGATVLHWAKWYAEEIASGRAALAASDEAAK